MNKLFQQLNQNKNLLSPNNNLKDMIKVFKGNPQGMTNMLLQKNPQLQQIISQSGGDAKTAFYNLARQRGVNPDDVLNMLK